MQEIQEHTRLSQGHIRNYDSRNRYRQLRRGRKKKKSIAEIGGDDNGFLKAVVKPIPIINNYEKPNFNELGSRDYLFDCLNNYLSLSGQQLGIEKTDNYMFDLNMMYHDFSRKIPEGIELDYYIFMKGDILGPVLYRHNYIFYEEFCFLPISIIDSLSQEVANLFKHFVAFYIESQKISSPINSMDFNWVIYEQAEELNECDDETRNEWGDLIETAQNYREGHISDVFGEISEIEPDAEHVLSLCNNSLIEDKREKLLIDIIKKGTHLLSKACLMDFNYDPDASDRTFDIDYDDFPLVEVDRLFAVVWSGDDDVVSYVEESLNTELREAATHGLIESYELKPNTKDIFIHSSFPEDFELWYRELISTIELWEN